MALLRESTLPRVALEEMNRVHDEEVALINALDAALAEAEAGRASGAARVSRELAALLAHIEAHFEAEERRMRAACFPAYAPHKAEHDRVLAEARAVAEAWRDTGEPAAVAVWLRHTVPTWMRNHIATMDTVTALYLANREAAS